MSTSDAPVPGPRRSRRAVALAARACALAGVSSCILAASALAISPPKYSLSIVEGETTQPENVIAHTSAGANHGAEVALSIVRGGVTVYRDSGSGGAWLSQVPQVGDVVTLESPNGHLIGAAVYDGLPSIDPTVCAGSANFSGMRSAGQTVEGGYFSVSPRPYFERSNAGQAQVTSLSGASFGGSFLTTLALGETVFASESVETPLGGGAIFTYSSENDRPVGACPVPPAPPSPPPPLALQGVILKLLHTTLHNLLRFGWRDQVGINQPGTVIQDLYLQSGGVLPAYAAASRGRHHARPPALLLARGTATASRAGTVSVRIKPTTKGRHRLKAGGRMKTVLITTLRSATGARLSLGRRTIILHG